MRIGIFGGTFDPPHLGHLILAAEAGHQLSLDKVLFVLTPDPPHKKEQQISNIEARLAMVQAMIKEDPLFSLSRVEVDRPSPHYAVDTVRLLRKEYPQDELVYLMGGDSLKDLPIDWHHPDEFVTECDFIGVMRRPQDEVNLDQIGENISGLIDKVQFMDAPLLEISSRQIRKRALEGRPYRYYLPEPVLNVVQEWGLYKPQ